MKKRIMAMLMCIVLMIGILPVTALAVDVINSGKCGENLTWMFTDDGVLTISGEGDMWDFEYEEPEWQSWYVNTIEIEEGVTSIGSYAFYLCENVISIRIPASLTHIGDNAFGYCTSLEEFIVDENNKHFSTDDNGTLFNKDKSELVKVPSIFEGSYNVPDSVTTIKSSAFVCCSSISSIILPASITKIEEYAFISCSSLKMFAVDENNQFYCNDENGVLFNKDKSTLIQAPMSGIRGKYIIPNSVTTIGDCAFFNCLELSEISIPESVTRIGDAAFFFCEKLSEVIIPDGVTRIGTDTFYYCSGLTEIEIPENVKSIGVNAFAWCESLEIINIPAGVSDIESGAFYLCGNVKKFTVDENNQYYSNDAYGVLFNKDKSILMQAPLGGLNGSYNIPATVSEIDPFAFYECEDLTAVTIPDSVTVIKESTFGDCISLADITIPNSVTSIGSGAFSGCEMLTTINIPASVTYIDGYAFYGNFSMLEVVVADENPNYSNDANGALLNKDKTELIYVPEGLACAYTVPASVKLISGNALEFAFYLNIILFEGDVPEFENLEVLWGKTVYYPLDNPTWTDDVLESFAQYDVTLIAYDPNDPDAPDLGLKGTCGDDLTWEISFDGTLTISGEGDMWDYEYNPSPWSEYSSSIKSVIIEEGVTSVGDNAFAGENLKRVSIPNTVTRIGAYAFSYCYDLDYIDIPSSVLEIGEWAFYGSLRFISVDEDNPNYCSDDYGVLYNKEMTEIISVPSGFVGEYIIPDSITHLDYATFYWTSDTLECVTIPASVTEIDDLAFAKAAIGKIIVDKNNPNYSSDEHGALLNKDMTELIYVPGGIEKEITIHENVRTIRAWALEDALGMYVVNTIKFKGDAPTLESDDLLGGRELTVYYPANNPTWTEEIMASFGEDITWIPYTPNGDVDGDGRVTNADLVKIARYIVDLYDEYFTAIEQYGDMDGDGIVTNADVVKIARMIVGLD